MVDGDPMILVWGRACPVDRQVDTTFTMGIAVRTSWNNGGMVRPIANGRIAVRTVARAYAAAPKLPVRSVDDPIELVR